MNRLLTAAVLSLLTLAACAKSTITTRIDPQTGKLVEVKKEDKPKPVFPEGSLFTLFQNGDISVGELNPESMVLNRVATLAFNPVWSPDGDRYAVVRAIPVTDIQQLAIIERNKPGDPIPVAQYSNELAGRYPFSMAFSPDGRKLLYTSVNADQGAIFVSDVKSRNTVMLLPDAERRTRRLQWFGDWILITLTEGRVIALCTRGFDFDTAPPLDAIARQSHEFKNLIEPKIHAGNLYGLEPSADGTRAEYQLVMFDLDGENTPKAPAKTVLTDKVGPAFDIAPDGTLALLVASAATRAPLELALGPRPNLLYHTGIRPYQIRFAPDGKRIFLVTVTGARPRYVMYSVAARTAVEFAALDEAETADQLSAIVRQSLMSLR